MERDGRERDSGWVSQEFGGAAVLYRLPEAAHMHALFFCVFSLVRWVFLSFLRRGFCGLRSTRRRDKPAGAVHTPGLQRGGFVAFGK